jgi:lipopolysaccharide/colanic/teichoic acid biosynthesis glycosyltransferase
MSVVSEVIRGNVPLAPPRAEPAPAASWYLPIKAMGEFIFALILLAVTAPLLLLAMVLVKLTSPGPIFYSQTRVGKRGRPFTLYKLPSMMHQCESLTGPCWAKPGDSRITRIGRWLRRTHLDELPQLWNVLKGDMSLIGPRPERPEFVPRLEQAIPLYQGRHQVRPGLTGLAQVQLPPDTDLASVRLKLAYDLYFVHNLCLWLEVRIHLATFLHILGIPFPWIRKVFAFPQPSVVERFYQRLVNQGARERTSAGAPSNNGALALRAPALRAPALPRS